MGKIIKTFPKLYGKTSVGKIKEWEISVIDAGNNLYSICTKHGLQDGKKQADVVIISEGKNIGRSNETTPKEQAISEAQAKWNKKNDGNYSTNIKAKKVELPMLAKKYGVRINKKLIKETDSKHIMFPCYVQPKLDGVRCHAKRVNDNFEFTSRNGKSYDTIKHINKQLKTCYNKGEPALDGEIYVHGKDFQDIISAVKNVKNKEMASMDCDKLEYWIYDIADDTKHFEDRLKRLNQLGICGLNIVIVPTYEVKNEKELIEYHEQFLKEGYEGTILRNKKGKYEFDERSKNLQKLKDFFDEEFKIWDVKKGKGRYAKCGTFVCFTKEGKQFNCNMKGTITEKEEWLRNKQKYIGEWITVRYQQLSKDKIPRFPVAICFRDYE